MAERLPIYEVEGRLVDVLRTDRRLLLCAPTGSGKSTQVPQMLLDHGLLGNGQVVVLQPRRIAARLLARRVAAERGVELGGEVGYQIKFENRTTRETRIRYVTEGILLRQMLQDRRLERVSAIIFDEFHERHLHGDVTLARALELQEIDRPDLRLVVMSATLDLAALEQYLAPCPILTSEGRQFPVQIEYSSTPGYLDKRAVWDQAADAFAEFVGSGGAGDVLIFMPGGFEIGETLTALRRRPESRGFLLLPLYGELDVREQDQAVARHERRKVVVATNVAETSLTIDGITCVIDGGLARIARYDPHRGINTLLIEKISRASADQRAGRAGRTAPGMSLRLWSREEHGHRAAQELPEIKRLDLAEVVLALKAAGAGNLRKFRWLEPPDPVALERAEELLMDLGALLPVREGSEPVDGPCDTVITDVGMRMLAFPLHPRYSRMLLAAEDQGCVHQACLVAALTQGRELLVRSTEPAVNHRREELAGSTAHGDFGVLMGVWQEVSARGFHPDVCRALGVNGVAARQVRPLLDQFLEIARDQGLNVQPGNPPADALRRCVLVGFSDRVARRQGGGELRFEMVHGRRGVLVRESVARECPLLVAAEIREVEGREKSVSTMLSLAMPVEESWLTTLFPGDITGDLRVFYDATSRRVQAEENLRFRGLAFTTRRVDPPPADEAARLLAQEVMSGRLSFEQWDDTVEQWIIRLNLLSKWCPELELPPLNPEDRQALVEQICHGSHSARDLKDLPVRESVRGWLSGGQQALLEKHVPERLTLANGRTPKIIYDASNPPHIAIRIQHLFGVGQSPRIAMGRVPVVLHILAPSMRPVQVTQDLQRFWSEHYPRIKQELQRKYPKHEWR